MDTDKGKNCHFELAKSQIPGSISMELFKSVPSVQDAEWTSRLYNLPKITFSTIYDYLVD